MRGDYACLRKRCKTGRELRREDEEEEELVGLASICLHFTKKEFCIIGRNSTGIYVHAMIRSTKICNC